MDYSSILINAAEAHNISKKAGIIDIMRDINDEVQHYASIPMYETIIGFPASMVPSNDKLMVVPSLMTSIITEIIVCGYSVTILKDDLCLIDLIPKSLRQYITDEDRVENTIKITPIKISWEDPEHQKISDER